VHPHHLAGRVALVSGVARPPGIGRATALRLAAAGSHVVCAERVSEDGAAQDTGSASRPLFEQIVEEVRAAGPGDVLAIPMASLDGWDAVVAAAVDRFRRLDICCALNGATGADAGDGPLLALTPRSWQRCLDINLTASFELMSAAARAMIAAGERGAIVALSSHAAQAPAPDVGAIGAARSAVEHLVAVLGQELAPHGIRCNAVSPLAVLPTELFPNPGLVAFAERAGRSTPGSPKASRSVAARRPTRPRRWSSSSARTTRPTSPESRSRSRAARPEVICC
jgi:NAD(P)-dependent dehydrogenase (short-subunit alcohol dehydrogenase family)